MMKNWNVTQKTLALLLALTLMLSLAACGNEAPGAPEESGTGGESQTASAEEETPEEEEPGAKTLVDRSGEEIVLPENVDKIISLAPSMTEVLVALGLGDKIIAVDTYSQGIAGIPEDIEAFDMMTPDVEKIAALEPDLLLVSSMSLFNSGNEKSPYEAAGICIAAIPSSDSIQGIREDIAFIALVTGEEEKGQALIDEMDRELERIQEIGETITEKKTVYFEVAAAPDLYSIGSGTYIHEMIGLLGGENIFGDQESWLSVSEEEVLQRNPDVIITNIDYLDDPVGEIMARPGWENITAVADGAVYQVDGDSTSQPNHKIIQGLLEMAKAVYPDYYTE